MKQALTRLVLMSVVAGFLFLRGHSRAAIVLASVAVLLGLLAAVAPDVSRTLDEAVERAVAWIATGVGLGLLALIYVTVFWAGAAWLRLWRIDVLNRKFDGDRASNWIDRVGYGADKSLYTKQYTRPHAAHGSKGTSR